VFKKREELENYYPLFSAHIFQIFGGKKVNPSCPILKNHFKNSIKNQNLLFCINKEKIKHKEQ